MLQMKVGMQMRKFAFYASTTLIVLVSCSKTTRFTTNGNAALSCGGGTCVAVGQYFHTDNDQGLPLAVFSDNNGATFETASQPVLPGDADPAKTAQLYGVHCVGEDCVAVGFYNLQTNSAPTKASPLAVFSHNSGKTFTSAVQPILPDDADPDTISALRGITNSNKRLVAVGLYNLNINGGFFGVLPLVVVSDDNGGNFIKTYQPNLPSDADTPTFAMLYSVSCVKEHCVSVGQYKTTADVYRPLSLISDDGGLSFTQFSQIYILNSVDKLKSIVLRSVTCEGLHCVAVGAYQYDITKSDLGSLPLVLVSEDGGVTFSMAATPSVPSDADTTNLDSQLKTISCSGLRCVAGGFYNLNPNDFSTGTALSVFSTDGGLTFATAPTVPLPTGGDSTNLSVLSGSSCLGENCVGVGIYNFVASSSVASPLAVFSPNKTPAFTSASEPTLPIGFDPTKSNTLGDIQP